MEAQRYPEDYDGVIAGAPVYDLLTTTGALLRYNNFAAPERRLAPPHLELINRSVLKACDARDGAADGIIGDPRLCEWDPGELACVSGAEGDACLTPAQVDAVRVAYQGIRTKSGAVAAYPLSRGSELGWTRFHAPQGGPPGDAASVGMSGLRPAFFDDANFDLTRFDADRDVARVRASALAKTYEAIDANLSAFVGRGGKLIIWHGFYDPGPGPLGTIAYYEQALRATKTPRDVAQSIRLFLAPGVAHCGGGPGADQIDFLSALERWVEHGEAPDAITATKKESSLSWPVCAYPAMTRGRGGAGYECSTSR
jgi:feruloyl esterase